ncbi:Mov34/MPN/PAD-1 family protein [Flammeovirga sp. EKP202]|uniref:Mov34/MPN/PAD-1 family protein n=1 Tax=Flammeovirga sp. EKP202 TaxID=2770592 RepID=UPI00165FCC12|nr:Mov34/MPN/PAD-1 family protein [Flammeovirga sp. EKP202]MBD0405295.1 Mov34/MPN/PAD-1 family protein [Flammeovirga sp. EKP202]
MCKALKFRLPVSGIIQINEDIVNKLTTFKQIESDSTEAGGIILGRKLIGTNNLIIDEITIPFPDDIRKRYSFKRKQENHQKVVETRWKESEKTENYLGEWHTHAEDNPTPSNIDKNDWKRRIMKDNLYLDFLISIIVGRKNIEIWVTDKQKNVIKLKKENV